MTTNFPTAIDALSNPSSGSILNSPSHSGQHSNANDAIEALETKVGVDSSAVTTSLDYKIRIGNPIGEIAIWSTNTAPTGWLICDGTNVSRTTYAALFAIVGVTYGVGDGTTTFALPNLKGKVPFGRNTADAAFDVLGETGGSATRQLITTNLPKHLHGYLKTSNTRTDNAFATGLDSTASLLKGTAGFGFSNTTWGTNLITNTTADGGNGNTDGDAFSIVPPYITLNYIIRT